MPLAVTLSSRGRPGDASKKFAHLRQRPRPCFAARAAHGSLCRRRSIYVCRVNPNSWRAQPDAARRRPSDPPAALGPGPAANLRLVAGPVTSTFLGWERPRRIVVPRHAWAIRRVDSDRWPELTRTARLSGGRGQSGPHRYKSPKPSAAAGPAPPKT